jgi:GDP-4-dehydro-6-deoxy-D-mannose reductase
MDGMTNSKRSFRKALITGVTGSGGSYLAEQLVASSAVQEVHGVSRWHSTSSQKNLKSVADKVVVHECDLLDVSSITRCLKEVRPDLIFHLAAHANVRASFINPLSVLENNIMGTANLYEGIRLAEIDPVFVLCSSSEVYGQVDPKDVPITEECPIQASSPYAVSKIAQDLLGLSYFRSYNMKLIRTRMFAYINPRRSDLFATSFAKQVARIELGLQKELTHGNLDSVRTLIDVRDAMRFYLQVAEYGDFGEVYNMGGKSSMKVGEFLDILKSKAKVDIPSRVDPRLYRPADVTLQIPDTSKFESLVEKSGNQFSWKPSISIEDSIGFLLDHCRKEVLREAEQC